MSDNKHVMIVNLVPYEAEMIVFHLKSRDADLAKVVEDGLVPQSRDEFESAAILTEDVDGEEG